MIQWLKLNDVLEGTLDTGQTRNEEREETKERKK